MLHIRFTAAEHAPCRSIQSQACDSDFFYQIMFSNLSSFDMSSQLIWPVYFMGTFCSTIINLVAEQLTSYPRRLWEVALGKYDNWCLFIVIEICSTAQWNPTPQRSWLATPGSKTSKIIHINTASSAIPPSSDVLHRNLCQLHFVWFSTCCFWGNRTAWSFWKVLSMLNIVSIYQMKCCLTEQIINWMFVH